MLLKASAQKWRRSQPLTVHWLKQIICQTSKSIKVGMHSPLTGNWRVIANSNISTTRYFHKI